MNRRAYNITVKKHANNLFGFVFNYLKNEEDSHDIVQDVFERLWENRKKVEEDKAKAWMFRTGHNALINFIHRKKRMIYDTQSIPDQGATDNSYETKEMVDKVLALLPPLQKSIVLLRDLEGYTYQEIGEILEISESQVKVYLFRARKKMKKHVHSLTYYNE